MLVSESLAESTWRRVAAIDKPAMDALFERCEKSQPELVSFVIAGIRKLDRAAAGIALYEMVVVFEMFRASGAKSRKATAKPITKHWKRVAEVSAQLQANGVEPGAFTAAQIPIDEPYVVQYVLDALSETSEGETSKLTAEEFWQIFTTSMTVVDALRSATTS